MVGLDEELMEELTRAGQGSEAGWVFYNVFLLQEQTVGLKAERIGKEAKLRCVAPTPKLWWRILHCTSGMPPRSCNEKDYRSDIPPDLYVRHTMG